MAEGKGCERQLSEVGRKCEGRLHVFVNSGGRGLGHEVWKSGDLDGRYAFLIFLFFFLLTGKWRTDGNHVA
jgi:hypothetical protein